MRKFHKVSFSQLEEDFGNEFPDLSFDEDNYRLLKLPQRATNGSIGYDFFAPFGFTLKPHEEIKIPTGIKVELDDSLSIMTVDKDGVSLPLPVYESLKLYPRSGQGFKFLRIANTVGVIDQDYFDNPKNEGHIWVKIRNENVEKGFTFEAGEAFCQGIIEFGLRTDDDKSNGATREGGLGSTDKRIM